MYQNNIGREAILCVLLTVLLACSDSSTGTNPDYNPPADHTVSKDGFKHKSGLRNPETNCASCHGLDLRGGETGVSCYECHNKKW